MWSSCPAWAIPVHCINGWDIPLSSVTYCECRSRVCCSNFKFYSPNNVIETKRPKIILSRKTYLPMKLKRQWSKIRDYGNALASCLLEKLGRLCESVWAQARRSLAAFQPIERDHFGRQREALSSRNPFSTCAQIVAHSLWRISISSNYDWRKLCKERRKKQNII